MQCVIACCDDDLELEEKDKILRGARTTQIMGRFKGIEYDTNQAIIEAVQYSPFFT